METSVAGHGALEREQEQEWAVRAGPHTRCGGALRPPTPSTGHTGRGQDPGPGLGRSPGGDSDSRCCGNKTANDTKPKTLSALY